MRFLYAVGALALIALPNHIQSAQASSSSSSVSDSSSSLPKSTFSSSSSSSHDSFSSLLRVAQSRIKHVVVLMMENRSFDHMLGWLHTDYNDKIDGLKPGMQVPRDPHDLSKGYVEVSRDGYDVGPDDPLHNFVSISTQIDHFAMDGFIYSAIQHHHNETNPVAMFDSKSAPVINGLAQEFAVFDKWFCSVPGPTDPNRAYAMAGTSVGTIENFDGNLWQQQSYFDLLTQNNHTWTAYYQQDVWAVGYFQDMQKPENSQNMKDLDDYFWDDVANGTLPEFTWLQPRSSPHKDYGVPTWQHPDAAVSAGEQLYHDVYQALRSSTLWNSTLFIITYDEHGGFYDHVPPPNKGIPNPDGIKADNGFNFDTLGIRVPTIAISPWIPKNTIISSALPFEQPTATSQFDATSIMATTHALLGLTDAQIPLLGARAEWSNTFVGLVTSLAEPRTDCPMTIGGKSKTSSHLSSSLSDHLLLSYQRSKPINDHQYHQLLFYCKQLYPDMGQQCHGLSSYVTENQGTAADWILEQSHIYLQRLRVAERAWLDEKELVAKQ